MLGHQTVKRKHDLYLTETPENPDRPHHNTEVWSGLRGVLVQKSLTETPVCPVHRVAAYAIPFSQGAPDATQSSDIQLSRHKQTWEKILVKNPSNQYVKIWKEYSDHKH